VVLVAGCVLLGDAGWVVPEVTAEVTVLELPLSATYAVWKAPAL
jgi:hypothetical protein